MKLEELTQQVRDIYTSLCYTTAPILQYNEFNEVVVEHRLLKEKLRLKAEQAEREAKAATKVPSPPLCQVLCV